MIGHSMNFNLGSFLQYLTKIRFLSHLYNVNLLQIASFKSQNTEKYTNWVLLRGFRDQSATGPLVTNSQTFVCFCSYQILYTIFSIFTEKFLSSSTFFMSMLVEGQTLITDMKQTNLAINTASLRLIKFSPILSWLSRLGHILYEY